jgi:TonB family protein
MKPLAATALAISLAGIAVADPLRVVVPGGPIAPGERIQLRAMPPAGPSDRERWEIVSGPGMLTGVLGLGGGFKAPYIVPAGGAVAVVLVTRGPREAPITATSELRLSAGSFPGADSCAGLDQAHVPEPGEYVSTDELPEAVTTVKPEYPASARARGIEGGLVVNALVCRTGRVIDTWVSWPVGATAERSLEDAATEAVRHWVFKPAAVAGRPVAVWVAIPLRFPPP